MEMRLVKSEELKHAVNSERMNVIFSSARKKKGNMTQMVNRFPHPSPAGGWAFRLQSET